jgi:predicted anti-sigma-YlaC factor YlaD
MTARMPTELACREMVQLITDYLEGVLPLADRTRFEQHLVFCAGCRNYVQQVRDLLRTVGRIPEHALTPAVQRDLVQAFHSWKAKKR